MSPEESERTANEILSLRREIAGLRQALQAKQETCDALRRRNDQLGRHLRLVQNEIQRVGLVAASEFAEKIGKDW